MSSEHAVIGQAFEECSRVPMLTEASHPKREYRSLSLLCSSGLSSRGTIRIDDIINRTCCFQSRSAPIQRGRSSRRRTNEPRLLGGSRGEDPRELSVQLFAINSYMGQRSTTEPQKSIYRYLYTSRSWPLGVTMTAVAGARHRIPLRLRDEQPLLPSQSYQSARSSIGTSHMPRDAPSHPILQSCALA